MEPLTSQGVTTKSSGILERKERSLDKGIPAFAIRPLYLRCGSPLHHDCMAAAHIRFRLTETFHHLGHDAVEQEDRRSLEERPQGRQSRLGGPAARLDQEDHVARMRKLRNGMSRDGDDLGPDPARDVRYLNRA